MLDLINIAKNIGVYVFLPFLISLFAAVLFWYFSFKHSNINIMFSNKLEKRKDIRYGKTDRYRFRIRITNIGKRNLIENIIIAKIIVYTRNGRMNTTYCPVGEESVIPILYRKYRKKEAKDKERYDGNTKKWKLARVHVYGLYINEVAYNEYSKNIYIKEIIEKAQNKTLELNDIFEAYPDTKMQIYVFGNDSVTGARRMYESGEYTKQDIVLGRFCKFSGIRELKWGFGINRKKQKNLLTEELSRIDEPKKILEKFLACPINTSEKVLDMFLISEKATTYRKDDKRGFVYIPGDRKDRVLLVAHADTVWDNRYLSGKKYVQSVDYINGYYKGKNQECGIGADDRAGCAILFLLRNSGHSILILDGEEHGQIGAHYLKDTHPVIFREINNEHQYIIQLDRRNAKEYKCYNIPVSQEFKDFIEEKTSYKNAGVKARTDIVVLCETICGVNLSVGYYNEHTPEEKLCYEEWLHTYEMLDSMLEEEQKKFYLEGIES